MLPLKDDHPLTRIPLITLVILGVNIYVFYLQSQLIGLAKFDLWLKYGSIPFEIVNNIDEEPCVEFSIRWTLVTSMFLHGGWLHLVGNMLYLWIFAKGVENEMGHLRFTTFYLLCGVLASLSHIASQPESIIPAIGASGAISGVMGAYLRLNPEAKILTVFVLPGTLIRLVQVTAFMYLIHWIIFQLVQGFYLSRFSFSGGGVAWFAHIGGFFAGLFLAKYFKKPDFPLWGIF